MAFAFAVFAAWVYGFDKYLDGDTEDYMIAANSFLNGIRYPRQSVVHPMFRPPLFPALIALIWSVFPQSILAVKISQAVIHAATAFVGYKIVFEVLKKKTPAFFGALILAFNPLLAGHTVNFYTEPLHTLLCALAMFFLLKLLKSGDDKYFYMNAGCAGIFFGLATLNRPAILGVVVILGFVLALFGIKNSNRLRYIIASAFMLGATFATILPWTFQNYRDTGEFILVNDGFSYNLWLGNLPETIKLYEEGFKTKEENQKFADHIWSEVLIEKRKELENTDNYSSLTINEREKVWRREALKNMTADYGLTARLFWGKLKAFWTPFVNVFTYGRSMATLVAAYTIFTFIFGFYGMYLFSAHKPGGKFVMLVLATFLVTTAIHVVIFAFVRYRVPNVDPYLSIFSGVAGWHLTSKFLPKLNKLIEN